MPVVRELSIDGFQGQRVPSTLVRQGETATQLAVFLPGFGYSCDMPLFYYAERLLLGRGVDVLLAEYAYNRIPGFTELPSSERHERINTDVGAVLRTAAGLGDYERIIVVAKSLGTRALAHHLSAEPVPNLAKIVWLTPILSEAPVRSVMRQSSLPSLVIIGTDDPYFDENLLGEATEQSQHAPVVIVGADHSLDVGLDPLASIQVLERALSAIAAFLQA